MSDRIDKATLLKQLSLTGQFGDDLFDNLEQWAKWGAEGHTDEAIEIIIAAFDHHNSGVPDMMFQVIYSTWTTPEIAESAGTAVASHVVALAEPAERDKVRVWVRQIHDALPESCQQRFLIGLYSRILDQQTSTCALIEGLYDDDLRSPNAAVAVDLVVESASVFRLSALNLEGTGYPAPLIERLLPLVRARGFDKQLVGLMTICAVGPAMPEYDDLSAQVQSLEQSHEVVIRSWATHALAMTGLPLD